jgi:hypothetical protein
MCRQRDRAAALIYQSVRRSRRARRERCACGRRGTSCRVASPVTPHPRTRARRSVGSRRRVGPHRRRTRSPGAMTRHPCNRPSAPRRAPLGVRGQASTPPAEPIPRARVEGRRGECTERSGFSGSRLVHVNRSLTREATAPCFARTVFLEVEPQPPSPSTSSRVTHPAGPGCPRPGLTGLPRHGAGAQSSPSAATRAAVPMTPLPRLVDRPDRSRPPRRSRPAARPDRTRLPRRSRLAARPDRARLPRRSWPAARPDRARLPRRSRLAARPDRSRPRRSRLGANGWDTARARHRP